jgi:nucleoside phosphorylase
MPARHDYRIGWICALPLELAAAQAMLDENHPPLPNAAGDRNNYMLGSIGPHNIVITCLPAGVYGTTSATATVIQMRFSYESIQWCLLVGIGGGVGISGAKADIRLGDVVVSEPMLHHPGVIQYDYGKAVQGGDFVPTGTLDKPPEVLLKALARLKAQHMVHGSTAHLLHRQALNRYPLLQEEFSSPGPKQDRLFISGYYHEDPSVLTCDRCDPAMLQQRAHRLDGNTRVFYGLIASANRVIKDSKLRDQLSQLYGILCFEMEAAGVMNMFPSLVIRGICDYSDSHKNKRWQGYAAMAAAAYAKELILFVPLFEVPVQGSLEDTVLENSKQSIVDMSVVSTDTLRLGPVKQSKLEAGESSTERHDTFSNLERHEIISSMECQSSSQLAHEILKGENNISLNQESQENIISKNIRGFNLQDENILEKILPETDPQQVLDIRLSMARKEGTWHPWPADCVYVYYALDHWLRKESPPLVVTPTSGSRTRVKDLAAEVSKYLIQWKKERIGPDFQVLWALGLSHRDRPKNELLKFLLFSINQAYPEVFRQTLSQAGIGSEIGDEEEGLWLLLRLLMSHITNAFVIVDPEDYQFLSRISNLANECYDDEATRNKVRFFIVCISVTNEIGYHRVVKVPALPPQARMRGLVREDLSWKLFRPGFRSVKTFGDLKMY